MQLLKIWRELDKAEAMALTGDAARRVLLLRAALLHPDIARLQALEWDDARSLVRAPEGTNGRALSAVFQHCAQFGRKGLVFFASRRPKPMPFPRALWLRVCESAGVQRLAITRFKIGETSSGARATWEKVLLDYSERVGTIEFRPLRKL